MNKNIKQLLIEQFYPINLLKDCSKGNQLEQLRAFLYNKEHTSVLEIPILNWLIITLYLLIAMSLLEKYEIIKHLNMISAILGIMFTLSFVVTIVFIASFMYLSYAPIIYVNEKKES